MNFISISHRRHTLISASMFVVLLIFSFAEIAEATSYSVKFCFKYDVDFDDAISAGGDYWTDNVSKTARGIHARIARNDNGAVVWEGYTGHSSGCTPDLLLSDTRSHAIVIKSQAKLFNDNYVYVYNASDNIIAYIAAIAFTPTSSATYTFTMTNASNATNIMAAAGYAVEYANAGESHEYHYFNYQHGGCTGSCTRGDGVYLSSNGKMKKFIITHESGHYFANEVFGGTGGGSIEYNSGSCDGWGSGDGGGHYFDSVEFQDSAASEGFAHFFAAATWNSTTDSDCEFIYYKPVDYDLRNGVEDPNGNYSCTAIGHFMEDYCNGDSPYVGLGNEADWLLFLWDLMKSYNSNAENIYDIWDAAQPGQGDWDRFECNDNLRAAAVNLGFSSFLWDLAAAVNGVDH